MTRSKLPSDLLNPYTGPYYETQGEQAKALHDSFETSGYESQKNSHPSASPGTGLWVLDHSHYQTWLRSTQDEFLWVLASPGCGKSVLSKTIIDSSLQQEATMGQVAICYFFFKDNGLENTLGTALCALIHQLIAQLPYLVKHARIAYSKYENNIPRYTQELWDIFERIVNDEGVSQLICVLDSLDQCREQDQASLINLICNRHQEDRFSLNRTKTLKWLVTSRPSNDIQGHMENISTVVSFSCIRDSSAKDDVDGELALIAREQVHNLSKELKLSAKRTKEVSRLLEGRAPHSHLWQRLAVNEVKISLHEASNPSRQLSLHLPESEEDMYKMVFARMSTEQRRYALSLLSIIIGARRPLTRDEMSLAMEHSTPIDDSSSVSTQNINVKQLSDNIDDWCGQLITTISGQLYISQQSVKDFLLRENAIAAEEQNSLEMPEIEKLMAIICVNFLSTCDLDQVSITSRIPQPSESKSPMQTFFEFASEHWAGYTRSVEGIIDASTRNRIKALYDRSGARFDRWASVMWSASDHWQYKFEMNHLQLAAFNGHTLLLRNFLESSPDDIDSRDFLGYTSLMWASKRGYLSVVRLLLDQGADLHAQGDTHVSAGTALHGASANGHVEIVQELIRRGADVNVVGTTSALHAAASAGQIEVVRMLIDAGADAHKRFGFHCNALHCASQMGHLNVVQALIEIGADVNATDTAGGNGGDQKALFAAAGQGHLDVVEALLDAGADVNASAADDYEGTALQVASTRGYLGMVKTLLQHGASAGNPKKPYGALQTAACQGHFDIVLTLLEAGVDADVPGDHRGTALQEAAFAGRLKIVRLLLDWGADVDARSAHHGTALQAAASRGNLDIVQTLLDGGADCNVVGGFYGSALDAAIAGDRSEVKKLLLAKGARLARTLRKNQSLRR